LESAELARQMKEQLKRQRDQELKLLHQRREQEELRRQ
jgi:hypothetical protein